MQKWPKIFYSGIEGTKCFHVNLKHNVIIYISKLKKICKRTKISETPWKRNTYLRILTVD
jgi:hypothetical protein